MTSQHFQGLRRAQNKADTNGSPADNPRRVDPTTNPITRRPGPGRGRPRKQPPVPLGQPDDEGSADLAIQESALADPPAQAQPPPQAEQHQPPPPPPPLPQSDAPAELTAEDPTSAVAPPSMTVPESEAASLELIHNDPDVDEQPAKRQKLEEDAADHIDDDATALELDHNGNVDALMHHDLPE